MMRHMRGANMTECLSSSHHSATWAPAVHPSTPAAGQAVRRFDPFWPSPLEMPSWWQTHRTPTRFPPVLRISLGHPRVDQADARRRGAREDCVMRPSSVSFSGSGSPSNEQARTVEAESSSS